MPHRISTSRTTVLGTLPGLRSHKIITSLGDSTGRGRVVKQERETARREIGRKLGPGGGRGGDAFPRGGTVCRPPPPYQNGRARVGAGAGKVHPPARSGGPVAEHDHPRRVCPRDPEA